MIRRKIFRLSLALLALASAVTATPKKAMAFGGSCPSTAALQLPDTSYDYCTLVGPSGDCSNCVYYCPLESWFTDPPVNFCAD